jgi:hypothetical protein
MNTQSIRDELSEFVYSNFDPQDMEILNELSEIFIKSHSCLSVPTDEQTMDGLINTSVNLNLDTILKFMQRTDNRKRTFETIRECIHTSVISSATPGQRGGNACQIVFNSLEGFIQACLCLRGPRAQLVSKFSAKCTSMVVRLHLALQKDLKKTKAELAEEKAQVQRRVFLVVKEAVKQWRRENGLRYTDCDWRLKNYSACCKRLHLVVYRIGNTPYVQPKFLRNAHDAIKYFYEISRRNPISEQPKYTQMKLGDKFVQSYPLV